MLLPRGRSDLARRFGPMLGLAVALVLVATVLPSALNLPQSNPTTTPEYAPVPPQDDEDSPPDPGNLSNALGLGVSDSFGAAAEPGGPPLPDLPPPPPPPGSAGKSPREKLCVGNPPRQTEDPLSPPCVGYFDGDNGGATGQGVTRNEVRILWAFNGRETNLQGRNGSEQTAENATFDLCQAAAGEEDYKLRALRIWQTYFNHRFQTYDRKVCFTVVYGRYGGYTPEYARSRAIQEYERHKPFAVVPSLNNSEEYVDEMARRGVVAFSRGAQKQSLYQRYAGFLYGYEPTYEYEAERFASYVCQKVAPYPVSFSGIPADLGKPRRYGLVWTTDVADGDDERFVKDLVKTRLARCGVTFAREATFPETGHLSPAFGNDPTYAERGMAEFEQAGVTTVIYPSGFETQFSQAAARQDYRPEWVINPQDAHDGIRTGGVQEQSVWRHATALSQQVRLAQSTNSAPCDEAYAEVAPTDKSADRNIACAMYDTLRQTFTGIQVAGPRLTARSMDQGLHAIPPKASSSPTVPACFYPAGDFTCVKDSTALFWDPEAPNALGTVGCWRMVQDGLRYLPGRWPNGDVTALRKPGDVCQTYQGSANL